MKNLEKKSSSLLVPALIGAAAAAAVTYLFLTEDGSELRNEYTEKLTTEWDSLKEKYPEQVEKITAVKDKVVDAVTAKLSGAAKEADDLSAEVSSQV